MTLPLCLVGGSGSSGTTWLATRLDERPGVYAIPEIAAFHHRALFRESGFGPRLHEALARGLPGVHLNIETLREALVPEVFLMQRRLLGLDDPEARAALLAAADDPDRFLRALHTQLRRRFDWPAEMTWIEHTPKNVVAAAEALEAVPWLRFVHVVRDGRAVVASLARRHAAEHPGHSRGAYLTAAAARWLHDVHAGRRTLGHPRALELYYEDLVARPDATLDRVLTFLGRPSLAREDARARGPKGRRLCGGTLHGGTKPTWSHRPEQAAGRRGLERWRTELSREERDALADFAFTPPGSRRALHFGETLAQLGYVKEAGTPLTAPSAD